MTAVRERRVRRTCLSVPGSSQRMIEKARTLMADMVFLDLEDSVSPVAKDLAREQVAQAIAAGGYHASTFGVRLNEVASAWIQDDVDAVVAASAAAPRPVDTVVLPKVDEVAAVHWLDLALTSAERRHGLPVGSIRIDAQIETATALLNVDAIAASSPRLAALVFGPADFMASMQMRSLSVGDQPEGYDIGDAYHYTLMRIVAAARSHDLAAIDGPYLRISDLDGLARVAGRSAALGFDGKWVLHPDQIDTVNNVFTPTQQQFDEALALLAAYDHATSVAGGARGAVMFGDGMIDEASRKMAEAVAARGQAAGLTASS